MASTGKSSGAGSPPANESTSGRSATLRISRTAEAFMSDLRWASRNGGGAAGGGEGVGWGGHFGDLAEGGGLQGRHARGEPQRRRRGGVGGDHGQAPFS